jgi:uncharacterized protein YbjT (DUF2867 family)
MFRKTTLVIGATGKTGRRVAERLKARNLPRETAATGVWHAGPQS